MNESEYHAAIIARTEARLSPEAKDAIELSTLDHLAGGDGMAPFEIEEL